MSRSVRQRVALKCSPHAPTHCLAQRSLCCHQNIHWLMHSPPPMHVPQSAPIKQRLQQKQTTNAKTIQRRRLACSLVPPQPIRSPVAKFLSTLPTMCSWVMALAPSWPCQVVTNATSNSLVHITCPSRQLRCPLLHGLNNKKSNRHLTAAHGRAHSLATVNTSTQQTTLFR